RGRLACRAGLVGPRFLPSIVLARIALLGILLTLAPASAQPLPQQQGAWRELLSPERREGQLNLQLGLAKLLVALGRNDPELGDAPRWLLIEQALLRFARARRALPDDPDVLYLTAIALTHWERYDGGALERRGDEALEAWRELRRRHPDFHPERVAFE